MLKASMIQKIHAVTWIIFILTLWFMLTSCNAGKEESEFVRCKMCGMNAAISEGKFSLYYPDGEVYQTCSGHCAALIAAHKNTEIQKAEAFAHDLKKMVNVEESFFVINADIIPKNSMYPSVFSFSNEEKAQDFQKIHGGVIVDFSGVLEMGRKKI